MRAIPPALLLILSLGAARAEPAVEAALGACRGGNGARAAGTALCFSGEIDAASAAKAVALMANPALTHMVVTSDGGEVRASLRLARALRSRGLTLVVDRLCYSACANFLFPAARSKVVPARGLVVFHGGLAPAAFGGLFGGGGERALQAETAAFFREIGVNGAFTYDPPSLPGGAVAEEWTASPQALARYGVAGIRAMWWPGRAGVTAEGAAQGMRLGVLE